MVLLFGDLVICRCPHLVQSFGRPCFRRVPMRGLEFIIQNVAACAGQGRRSILPGALKTFSFACCSDNVLVCVVQWRRSRLRVAVITFSFAGCSDGWCSAFALRARRSYPSSFGTSSTARGRYGMSASEQKWRVDDVCYTRLYRPFTDVSKPQLHRRLLTALFCTVYYSGTFATDLFTLPTCCSLAVMLAPNLMLEGPTRNRR